MPGVCNPPPHQNNITRWAHGKSKVKLIRNRQSRKETNQFRFITQSEWNTKHKQCKEMWVLCILAILKFLMILGFVVAWEKCFNVRFILTRMPITVVLLRIVQLKCSHLVTLHYIKSIQWKMDHYHFSCLESKLWTLHDTKIAPVTPEKAPNFWIATKLIKSTWGDRHPRCFLLLKKK